MHRFSEAHWREPRTPLGAHDSSTKAEQGHGAPTEHPARHKGTLSHLRNVPITATGGLTAQNDLVMHASLIASSSAAQWSPYLG